MQGRSLIYGSLAVVVLCALLSLDSGAARATTTRSFGRTTPTYARTPAPKVLSNIIWVSDSNQNVVTAYENNVGKGYPILGSIPLPARPEGITTDQSNNLYVTQQSGNVLVYPPATFDTVDKVTTYAFPTKASETLVDANNPTDVALGPDGEIYVADQGGPQSATGKGQVEVYVPGTTTAAYTIPFGAGTYVDGVTLDSANNLYIAYRDATGTAYINVSPAPPMGQMRTTGTYISAITGDIFRGVQYDDKHSAVVYADYSKPDIYEYPPVNRDKAFDKLGSPDYIGFNKSKSQLFVPDFSHNLIEVYNYPSGSAHAILNGIENGAPAGCALLPAPPL